jgi:hypothetical protein
MTLKNSGLDRVPGQIQAPTALPLEEALLGSHERGDGVHSLFEPTEKEQNIISVIK